jgi:hypothetical protein
VSANLQDMLATWSDPFVEAFRDNSNAGLVELSVVESQVRRFLVRVGLQQPLHCNSVVLGDKQQCALMGVEVRHSPNNASTSSILRAAHAAVLAGR